MGEWVPCATAPKSQGVYLRKDVNSNIGWQRWCDTYWGRWYSSDTFPLNENESRIKSDCQTGWWKELLGARQVRVRKKPSQ